MESRILAKLLSSEEITHKDIWFTVATYRLASIIHTLRKKYGWLIIDKWEQALTKDPIQRIARYKRYYIEKSTVALVGEDRKNFIQCVQQWEIEEKAKRAAATAQLTNRISTVAQSYHTSGDRK